MATAWVLCCNASAEWQDKDHEEILNTGGLVKGFPIMGPQCNYNGDDISSFCYCSENGSITANFYVEMVL